MQDSFDIVTIVFLCLAVFVIWRLRSVLGQRTGNERPPYDPFTRQDLGNAKPDLLPLLVVKHRVIAMSCICQGLPMMLRPIAWLILIGGRA